MKKTNCFRFLLIEYVVTKCITASYWQKCLLKNEKKNKNQSTPKHLIQGLISILTQALNSILVTFDKINNIENMLKEVYL